MKLSVYLIPMLIVTAGVVSFVALPLDVRLRGLILAADVFAAAAVGLILWRQDR
ncbi:MAG: hypothetical protein KF833_18450 [Verrucomicrobiae bacterium]|nr:hypothetical protein [Verrucomicrobiae bacterium]